jgi:predicted transcriptional regulator
LEVAAQHLSSLPQLAFPVLHGDALVGLISRSEIASALANLGPTRHISEVMRREIAVAQPGDPLLNLLPQLQRPPQALPVMEEERLVGLITLQELAAKMSK